MRRANADEMEWTTVDGGETAFKHYKQDATTDYWDGER